MLNSTRDKAIKRYLAKVGTLFKVSRYYASRYYKIEYESTTILVRFSGHFNTKTEKDIDIVKISNGLYIIKSLGCSYALTEDNIMTYLKSILLVYPEFNKTISTYTNATKKYQNDLRDKIKAIDILQKQLGNVDVQAIEKLQEENDRLTKKLEKARKSNEDLRCKLNKLQVVLQNTIKDYFK